MAKSQKNNDSALLELKKQVADKKAALAAAKTFIPKTNCSIVVYGERTNIRATTPETLVTILVHINSMRLSAEDLGLESEFKFCGFSVQDWIDDLQSLVLSHNLKQEQDRLKILEDRLYNLLSVDKKVELEIDALSKQI